MPNAEQNNTLAIPLVNSPFHRPERTVNFAAEGELTASIAEAQRLMDENLTAIRAVRQWLAPRLDGTSSIPGCVASKQVTP